MGILNRISPVIAGVVGLALLSSCNKTADTTAGESQETISQISGKENLVDGKRQGQYVKYFPSGQIEMSCNYRDGKLDGPIVFYYEPSGHIYKSATYKDGILTGIENVYYEDGNLKSTLTHGENSSLVSINSYYQSGLPFMEMSRNIEQASATLTFYHENGRVSEVITMKKMTPVGDYIAYYEDGTVKKTGSYKNGRLSGTWRFYDRNGNLEKELRY